MIYDCFMFFNEFDLLDIRLNLLDKYVDKFVICESALTHSGKIKPLYFLNNAKKFDKFLDKIIYLEFNDGKYFPYRKSDLNIKYTFGYNNRPIGEYDEVPKLFEPFHQYWYNEHRQRKHLINGLKNCSDDDIIMVSDIDEIPNFETILKFFNNDINSIDTTYYCAQDLFYYYFNNLLAKNYWIGTYISKFKFIKDEGLNYYRYFHPSNDIYDCGWHFSYIGETEHIYNKLQAFVHQEFQHITKNEIETVLKTGEDLFKKYESKIIDHNFLPDYIKNNYSKYIKY